MGIKKRGGMTWPEDKIKEYQCDPYRRWIIEDHYRLLHKYKIAQYFKDHHGEHFTAADVGEELGIDFWICDQVCENLRLEGKIK